MGIKHCYLCYSTRTDDDFICDTCDEYYCEDCSYTFGIYYQFQGSRCYMCADQDRRTKRLTREEIRDNKLELCLKSIREIKE